MHEHYVHWHLAYHIKLLSLSLSLYHTRQSTVSMTTAELHISSAVSLLVVHKSNYHLSTTYA